MSEQEMTKEEKELAVLKDEQARFVKAVKDALAGLPGVPSEEAIQQMKTDHGEVLVSAIDDDMMYLFRPLTRFEYLSIRRELAEKAQDLKEGDSLREGLFEEKVVKTCVLWESLPGVMEKKGGTIDMLFEQVMAHSNFVNPQAAVSMVVKL